MHFFSVSLRRRSTLVASSALVRSGSSTCSCVLHSCSSPHHEFNRGHGMETSSDPPLRPDSMPQDDDGRAANGSAQARRLRLAVPTPILLRCGGLAAFTSSCTPVTSISCGHTQSRSSLPPSLPAPPLPPPSLPELPPPSLPDLFLDRSSCNVLGQRREDRGPASMLLKLHALIEGFHQILTINYKAQVCTTSAQVLTTKLKSVQQYTANALLFPGSKELPADISSDGS